MQCFYEFSQYMETIRYLLNHHAEFDQTLCEEVGIVLSLSNPNSLFQLLILSVLLSKRILSRLAVQAFKAFVSHELIDALSIIECPHHVIVKILKSSGYSRYDESTAHSIRYDAWLVMTRYSADMRNLFRKNKDASNRTIESELLAFKGIGPVGYQIFLSEVQVIYTRIYPRTTPKAIVNAQKLSLDINAIILFFSILPRSQARLRFTRFMSLLSRLSIKQIRDVSR